MLVSRDQASCKRGRGSIGQPHVGVAQEGQCLVGQPHVGPSQDGTQDLVGRPHAGLLPGEGTGLRGSLRGASCRGHAGCRPPLHWGAGTGSRVPPGSLHWGDIITRGQGMQGSAPCWAAARTLQEGLGQSKPWAPVTGSALSARRLLRGSMVRMPASSASAFLAAGASFARRTTLLCCRCPAAVVSWTRICAQRQARTGDATLSHLLLQGLLLLRGGALTCTVTLQAPPCREAWTPSGHTKPYLDGMAGRHCAQPWPAAESSFTQGWRSTAMICRLASLSLQQCLNTNKASPEPADAGRHHGQPSRAAGPAPAERSGGCR